MANRLWQYHFGRGIVPTPNDFGGLGEPPTHPELLDWLAAELMDGGWRLKTNASADRAVERLPDVVARLAAGAGRATRRIAGSGGSRCAGSPRRRFAIRSWPSAARSTSRPADRASIRRSRAKSWPANRCPARAGRPRRRGEAARRSVYVHVKRSLLVPILATHDAADTDFSCPGALYDDRAHPGARPLNGAFSNEQAARFADRLRREAPATWPAQVRRAIRLTTAREPADDEVRWRRGVSSTTLISRSRTSTAQTALDPILSARRSMPTPSSISTDEPEPPTHGPRLVSRASANSVRLVLRPDPARVSLGDRRRLRVGRADRPCSARTGFCARQAVAADGSHAVRQPASRPSPATARQRPRASSSCSCTAAPATSTPSTTSPIFIRSTARRSRSRRSAAAARRMRAGSSGPSGSFHQYGQCGKWVSDSVPASGDMRRRHRLYSLDVCRVADPRLGDADDEFGTAALAGTPAWAPGSTTAWEARTKTCRASW